MAFFTGTMGLPYAIALLPVLTEFLAPIAFVFRILYTHRTALALGVNFLVVLTVLYCPTAFSSTGTGTQKGPRASSTSCLFSASVLALIVGGAGLLFR